VWLYRSFFSTPVEGRSEGIKTIQSQLSVTVTGAVQSRVLRWEFLTCMMWTFILQLAAWQQSFPLHHRRNACFGEWGELVTQPHSRLSGFRLSSVESWHRTVHSHTRSVSLSFALFSTHTELKGRHERHYGFVKVKLLFLVCSKVRLYRAFYWTVSKTAGCILTLALYMHKSCGYELTLPQTRTGAGLWLDSYDGAGVLKVLPLPCRPFVVLLIVNPSRIGLCAPLNIKRLMHFSEVYSETFGYYMYHLL
jgi:hypothetical protein